MKDWYTRAAILEQQGLYDPATEHDACGVGVVVSLDGKPRRDVVEKGIEALKNVYHRGAVDADGKTGDGAGILVEIPREFFRSYLERIGKQRTQERIAVGMLFLPKKNLNLQDQCRQIVEDARTIAGLAIRIDRATMPHRLQRIDRRSDHAAARTAIRRGDKANAASVAFHLRMIHALGSQARALFGTRHIGGLVGH